MPSSFAFQIILSKFVTFTCKRWTSEFKLYHKENDYLNLFKMKFWNIYAWYENDEKSSFFQNEEVLTNNLCKWI